MDTSCLGAKSYDFLSIGKVLESCRVRRFCFDTLHHVPKFKDFYNSTVLAGQVCWSTLTASRILSSHGPHRWRSVAWWMLAGS